MKNYQKLKQIIHEANPEIMELKFGCEVEINIEKLSKELGDKLGLDKGLKWNDVYRKGIFICEENDYLLKYKIRFCNGHWMNVRKKDIKILGRPIRFADVLMAISDKRVENKETSDGLYDLVNKNEIERILCETAQDLIYLWNLADNNLDHQSDPTKRFLIELLT